jgi:N utilization substance protein B
MGARRKGRELAVQALYQIELQGEHSAAALQLFWEQADAGPRAKEFAARLVEATVAQRQRIDDLIAAASAHWRMERLSAVDLNVLRVATGELLTGGTPTSVVLDEAIEVARRFGSADSPTFVNGVLDQIASQLGVKDAPAERSSHQDG